MGFYIFNGVLYLTGLALLAMPPEFIPGFDGTKASVRLTKHAVGLGFFMVGTMEIHEVAREWTGYGFILSSTALVIVLALLRVYVEAGAEN